MAVRTRPLAAISTISGGIVTTLYTVPVNRTAIVRHWSVTNHHSGALVVRFIVRIAGVTADVYRDAALAAGSTHQGRDWYLALGPGDAAMLFVSGATGAVPVHCVMAGSLLEGIPQ